MRERTQLLLIIDDSEEDRIAYRRAVETNPGLCAVQEAESGREGLRLLRERRPDCVLLDYRLPDMDGVELLRTLVRETAGTVPVIVVTGGGDEQVAVTALKLGARDYLVKDVAGVYLTRLPTLLRRVLPGPEAAAGAADGLAHAVQERERDLRLQEHRLRQVVQHNRDGMLVRAGDGRLLFANPAAQHLLGHGLEPVVRHLAAAPEGAPSEVELPADGDGPRFLEVFRTALVWDGEPAELLVVHDLTARRRAEAALRLRERAIESASNGIMLTGAGPGVPIVYVNPAFERITGYCAAEVVGRSPAFLHGGDRDQPGLAAIGAAVALRRETTAVLRNYRRDGSPFWNELHVAPVEEAGEVRHFVGILNDISEARSYQEQLEQRAHYDELTGLANRNLMLDRLEQLLAAVARHGRMGAVLFLDLDRFKVINDSLGHRLGDAVLAAVAERLRACAREGDTVARYGGDEFVLLLPTLAREDDASAAARRIAAALVAPLSAGGESVRVGASIGITVFPRDGLDSEVLLKHADAAMYRAKEAGGSGYAFFTEAIDRQARERFELERGLRQALERDELVVHYQPQVDLASGRITGLEALVRWRHPQQGLIAPARFIPVAEACGLIEPIGEWVLRRACEQGCRWQRSGLTPVTLAVNVSVRQLERAGFAEAVATCLSESGFAPERLDLELTESAIMHQVEDVVAHLRALKANRSLLSIDDFGTGYSSLASLKRLPFDKLKIDRSFIAEVTSDPNDAAIVQAIVAMARRLGLRTVAEGVERESQLNYLRRLGCDEAQGFYFSRPLPAAEVEALLGARVPFPLPALDASERPTLLVLDDEPNVLRALRRTLRPDGYRVLVAGTAEAAFEQLANHDVQVVIGDQRLRGLSGTEFLHRVKDLYPAVIRLLLTGYTDLATVTEAVNRGWVFKLLLKPWDDEGLRGAVREAFAQHRRAGAGREAGGS